MQLHVHAPTAVMKQICPHRSESTLCCCSGSVLQAAPADAATAWRRNIYADGMYAVPVGALLLHVELILATL